MAATFTAESAYTFRGAAFKVCNVLFTSGDFQLLRRHCSPGYESGAMWPSAHAAMAMPAKQSREFYCELNNSAKAASRYKFISHAFISITLERTLKVSLQILAIGQQETPSFTFILSNQVARQNEWG